MNLIHLLNILTSKSIIYLMNKTLIKDVGKGPLKK